MTAVEVKRFKIEDGILSGPADYMQEQGNKKLDAILSGKDMCFNMSSHLSPSVEVAILVHLQTDYAAYLGQQQMAGWLKK